MFFIFPKVVTPEVCDEIITDCKKNALVEAKIGNGKSEFVNDPQTRKTSVHFIKDRDNKINDFIWQLIREANRIQFHYYLDHFQPIQFSEYKGSENYRAFYDWHQDSDGSSKSGEVRKLSLSLPLSDPDTYEGGKLEFYNGGRPLPDMGEIKGEQVTKDINSQGTATIFDSRDWHRISPMISGVRYSIVCWTVGPNFK
tara:strand:- start:1 stop:594 length:594 start_codon:yes stop_codon:yes gene_type:complete